MTVTAKTQFVEDVTDRIGDYLTMAITKRVVSDINTCLLDYSVDRLNTEYDPSKDDCLALYIDAKRVEGKSDKTINRYVYILEKALKAIGSPTTKITTDQIRSYLGSEKERGLSNRSLESVRQVLSAYFNWANREGLLIRNPMSNLGAVKYTQEIRYPYSSLELDMIKRACRDSRDRAIVDFLLTTGCRISEVCALDRSDIDFNHLEVKVLGKGDKERVVYITEVAAASLKQYLAERTDNNPCLFYSQRGRLTPGGFRAMLNRLSRVSGVRNVHPHRFRRTLATNLIKHGMPIQEVSKILGHSKLDTTMTYVYIAAEDVKNSYRKYF